MAKKYCLNENLDFLNGHKYMGVAILDKGHNSKNTNKNYESFVFNSHSSVCFKNIITLK